MGNLIFASGQIPIDPKSGGMIEGDIEVKTTIFLKDMNNFARVNKIYDEYFKGKFPARSCVEVSRLPKDAEMEIEAIAFCI